MANKGQSVLCNWLRAHTNHRSEACLIWPFGCSRGYGTLKFEGRIRRSHQVMCELAHGPKPHGLEASHSCGNGMCVNPDHLSWKTRAANQHDRHKHGTTTGRPTGGYKLTPEKVAEIRAKQGAETVTALAARFGVTRSCIRQIHLRKTWTHGIYAGFGSGSILAEQRRAEKRRVVTT